jgi:hypothetical protein
MSENTNTAANDQAAFESITFKRPTRPLPKKGSERDAEKRQSISFFQGSRFNVPKSVRESDPDHVYAFVPYMTANMPWQESVDNACVRGYEPVKKSEHPELSQRYVTDLFGKREDFNNDYVRKGGQILMKRPKYLDDAENEEFLKNNRRHEEMSKHMILEDKSYRGPLGQFWRHGRN